MADEATSVRVHRVDPRLVHATLLEAWLPFVGATHLVVADTEVASDPRRRIIFEMSARDVDNVHFVPEPEVSALLATLPPGQPTIVVYGSLEGFADAVEAGLSCNRVLLGHLPDGPDRRRVHPSVYVGHRDLEQVERLRALGVDVVVRALPTDLPRRLRRGEDGRPVLTEDDSTLVAAEQPPSAAPEAGSSVLVEETTDAAIPAKGDAQSLVGTVTVVNERGLHLRAAHVLAQATTRFSSMIQIGWPGRLVNAKSLLGITTLGAAQGAQLELRVEGEDAEQAFRAITELFASGFDEGPG